MKKTLLVTAMVCLMGFSAFGESRIRIDNDEIQSCRGITGKWVLVSSQASLRYYLARYQSSYRDFIRANGRNYSFDMYLFIPYSQKVIDELRNKGHQRSSVNYVRDTFIWPLEKAERINSPFGMRMGELHAGVDIPAARGVPIISAMDGIVVNASYSGGHGKSIYIEHRNNFYTRYSHCSVMVVKKGDFVRKGQVIGFAGSTGNSTGNHLHFEIRYRDIPLNPLDFLPEIQNIEISISGKSHQ